MTTNVNEHGRSIFSETFSHDRTQNRDGIQHEIGDARAVQTYARQNSVADVPYEVDTFNGLDIEDYDIDDDDGIRATFGAMSLQRENEEDGRDGIEGGPGSDGVHDCHPEGKVSTMTIEWLRFSHNTYLAQRPGRMDPDTRLRSRSAGDARWVDSRRLPVCLR